MRWDLKPTAGCEISSCPFIACVAVKIFTACFPARWVNLRISTENKNILFHYQMKISITLQRALLPFLNCFTQESQHDFIHLGIYQKNFTSFLNLYFLICVSIYHTRPSPRSEGILESLSHTYIVYTWRLKAGSNHLYLHSHNLWAVDNSGIINAICFLV